MKYLKIRSLEKGWRDRDELLLHAAFQILVDFYEQECGPNNPFRTDWNFREDTKHAWSEIKYLYKWWTRIRPARKDPIYRKGLKVPPFETKLVEGRTDLYELIHHDPKKYRGWENAVKKSAELEEKWEKEDQENLHRLIDIRQYMWT